MTIPTLTTPPPAPSRMDDNPDEFVVKADDFMGYIEGLSAELNSWINEIILVQSGLDFNASSTTSNSVGTGSKSWSVGTGKAYQIGTQVFIARTSAPTTIMRGLVTGYSGGSLTVNVTSSSGSGTYTDWSIGLDNSASFTGGTLTSALTLVAAASGQESLIIPHGAAPSSPTNGSIWTTTAGIFVRLNGTTYQLAPLASPTFTGSIYTNGAVRGASTAMGAVDLDCSTANHFTKTINGNTTFTFSNIPAGLFIWTLELTHTSGTITLPAACIWEDGAAPSFTTGKTHLFVFQTSNSGTTVRVSVRKNYAS